MGLTKSEKGIWLDKVGDLRIYETDAVTVALQRLSKSVALVTKRGDSISRLEVEVDAEEVTAEFIKGVDEFIVYLPKTMIKFVVNLRTGAIVSFKEER